MQKCRTRLLTNLTGTLLKSIPGSLEDTSDLINDVRGLSIQGTSEILFSADLEALYPSIRWMEGITAAIVSCKKHMQEKLKKKRLLKPSTPAVFRECLELVVTGNVFHFQERKCFRQLKRSAMGTFSVYFANTFMWKRIEHLINNPPRELRYIHGKIRR